MVLIPLRHKADAERADERGDHTGALPAWDALLAQNLWNRSGHEVMSEALRGLEAWGSRHFRLPDLPPALVDVRGPQLAPLIECVAAAPDPAVLFEECLEQAQTTAKGGHYYTPLDIARLLTALMEPQAGEAVYDPVCGSGGFLLRAREYVEAYGGPAGEPALYGQDASRTALQTAAMNFTVQGVEGVFLEGPSSTLTDDRFPDLTFDVVVANPPFNQFGWDEGGHGRYGRPWRYGIPPAGNANFAWAQYVVSKMMCLALLRIRTGCRRRTESPLWRLETSCRATSLTCTGRSEDSPSAKRAARVPRVPFWSHQGRTACGPS